MLHPLDACPGHSDPVSTDPPADAAPRPWFAPDGLPFRCTQCGNCCTGSPGFVWVTSEEIQAIADLLDKPVGEIRLLHTRPARGMTSLTEFANGDCTFFDPQTRRCKVYAARPQQCRTWPFWQSNVASPEAWARTQSACPGAGQGDFVPLEEVLSRVSVIDL